VASWKQLIRRFLLTGLVALLPLLVTVYVLASVVKFATKWPGQWIHNTMKAITNPPGQGELILVILRHPLFSYAVALAFVIVVLLGLGFLLGTFVGRRLFNAFEMRIARLPMVRVIYPLVRQVTELVSSRRRRHFGQVVAVEYPRKGIYSIGFVTSEGVGEIHTSDGRRMVSVFVPNSPSPVTGWLLFYPPEEVLPLKMTVDEAFKLVVSGGVVVPPERKPDTPAAPQQEESVTEAKG